MEQMMPKSLWAKRLIKILILVAGNVIDAFGVAVFVLPYGFVISGATGAGKIISHFMPFDIPVVWAIYGVNILLFIIAWTAMGWKFARTIVIGTFIFPAALDIFQHMSVLQNLTENTILAMVFAAIFMGVGTGLVIRAGGSTGGADVIPIILHEKKGLPIARTMYTLDVIVMLFQLPFSSKEQVLLGILLSLSAAIVLDKTLVARGGEVQFLIFTNQYNAMNKALLQLDVGTTLLHGKGGYYDRDTDVILCIVSTRRMSEVKAKVLEMDPMAFMSISSVEEVSGRGFSLDRKAGLMAANAK